MRVRLVHISILVQKFFSTAFLTEYITCSFFENKNILLGIKA